MKSLRVSYYLIITNTVDDEFADCSKIAQLRQLTVPGFPTFLLFATFFAANFGCDQVQYILEIVFKVESTAIRSGYAEYALPLESERSASLHRFQLRKYRFVMILYSHRDQ